VHGTNHHRWVKETKSPGIAGGDESNLVETFGFPASIGIEISAEPSDTKDVHPLRWGERVVLLLDLYKNVKDVDDTGVPIGMSIYFFIFMREDHHISGPRRIDGVLIASHVVRRVVETHGLMEVNSASSKKNGATLFWSESLFPIVIAFSAQSTEDVILEVSDEILLRCCE